MERLRLAELAQASGRPGCERGRGCSLAAVQSRFVLLLLSGREADARTRTADPFITSEVLYQLSYVGGDVLG